MMKKLEGKVAVITGGNSGIGLATAQRFVSEGAYVFVTGRRQSELETAVKQIGKNVSGIQGDVSNLADLDRLYTTVKEKKGSINILFANAGVPESTFFYLVYLVQIFSLYSHFLLPMNVQSFIIRYNFWKFGSKFKRYLKTSMIHQIRMPI